MSATRRAAIYKLASAAQEADLTVMSGILNQDEDGHWTIDNQDVSAWFAAHEGEELVIVLGLVEDDRPMEVRTCRTCGRDYRDLECPHCRANRIRLRGHG